MKRPLPSWLRASAAAAVVGVTRRTITSWISAGQIPKKALLRCGRQYRVARWWCQGGVA